MDSLLAKKCVPCEGGTVPLSPAEVAELQKEIDGSWKVEGDKKIINSFVLKDFKEAIWFVIGVAQIAEQEGHHPDMHIFYNKVGIELSTHAIGGLSENDFILAAKIDDYKLRSGM